MIFFDLFKFVVFQRRQKALSWGKRLKRGKVYFIALKLHSNALA